MFKRKKKPEPVTMSVSYAEKPATDPTEPYRSFIEDLALVFPGIVRPTDGRNNFYYIGYRSDPLRRYEVGKVKQAADVLRAAEESKRAAERTKQSKEFIQQLRSAAPPRPTSVNSGAE